MLKPSEKPELAESMGAGLITASPKLKYDENEDEEVLDKDDGGEKFAEHILDDRVAAGSESVIFDDNDLEANKLG